jgi:hypothetical protein
VKSEIDGVALPGEGGGGPRWQNSEAAEGNNEAAEDLYRKHFLTKDQAHALLARRALLDNGYPFWVPCVGKHPVNCDWQLHHDSNPEEVWLWTTNIYARATNTGLLCRTMPTLDVDSIDPDAVDAARSFLDDQYANRAAVLFRYGSKGFAAPFRTIRPFEKLSVDLIAPNGTAGQKVEYLGNGQQVIIHGIHPETHAPYSWRNGKSPLNIRHRSLPHTDVEQARRDMEQIVGIFLARGFMVAEGQKRNGENGHGRDPRSNEQLERAIIDGTSLHNSIVPLAMRLRFKGLEPQKAAEYLRSLMQRSKARIERPKDWRREYRDIDRTCRISTKKLQRNEPPPHLTIPDGPGAHIGSAS